MTKKRLSSVLLVALMFTAIGLACAAQVNADPTITMKIHKDYGYSSFGNDAQGDWTVHATVSEDTTRVEFYLDDELQFDDTQTPFAWSYVTDDFPEGLHTIKAVAYDSNGNTATAEVEQNFVPFPMDFTIGIVIAVVVISVVVSILAVVFARRKTR
ncbi:MAG: Ig-like domain-containing protein [Candidatus Bathyarchaeota archaeon]|nr:Ig-like domain-containing protein [Candidatus Bathyarchaeota archaeon]